MVKNLSEYTLVTLDFETYYDKDCTLKKLSIPEYVGHKDFKVHMVGIKINNSDIFIVEHENIPETLKWLNETYGKIALIAQNTAFEGYILHALYNWHPAYYIDTMGMSRSLNPHKSASLKNLAVRLFPFNESLRKGNDLIKSMGVKDLKKANVFDATALYCKQDVNLTFIIFKDMLTKVMSGEMDMIDLLLKMFCMPVLKLNTPLLIKYEKLLETKKQKTINKANINPKVLSSNKQLAEYIKHVLKLDPPMKISPTTGLPAPALAKNDLELHRFIKEHPETQDMWNARAAVKSTQNQTRVHRFIEIARLTGGYLPAFLTYSAAHTHRLGGGDRTNLQNLPRNAHESHEDKDLRPGVLRRAIVAPDGYQVHVRDQSNIEARVLAEISGQSDLVEQFRDGLDPYAALATRIYGRTISKKTDPFERNVGKVAVLGLGYGMGVDKFRDTLNAGPLGMAPIFFEENYLYGHIVKNVYRVINSQIVAFWKKCDQFIYWMATAKDGEVLEYKCLKVYKERIELPNGQSLIYENLRQENGSWQYDSKRGGTFIYGGKLTENIVQALAQIIIKSNMLELAELYPRKNAAIVLQVHDEVISVVKTNLVEEFDRQSEVIMAKSPPWMPNLPLASEGGWADNYSK